MLNIIYDQVKSKVRLGYKFTCQKCELSISEKFVLSRIDIGRLLYI